MQKTLFNFFKKTPKSSQASDANVEKKKNTSSATGEGKAEGHSGFPPGSLVWAKLPGYPWWPSMVCNHPTPMKG